MDNNESEDDEPISYTDEGQTWRNYTPAELRIQKILLSCITKALLGYDQVKPFLWTVYLLQMCCVYQVQ